MQSIELINDNDISDISSMTSVGTIFTETKDTGVSLLTWVVFDGHEDTLIWDIQAIPGDNIASFADSLGGNGYTAGNLAEDSLDDPIRGSSITLVYRSYELNEFGIPVETGSDKAGTGHTLHPTHAPPAWDGPSQDHFITICANGFSTLSYSRRFPNMYCTATNGSVLLMCNT